MFSTKKLGITAIAFVAVLATVAGLAAGQSPDNAGRAGQSAVGLSLPPAADTVYKYIKLRGPNDLKWQQIPWLVDLPEAVRQAKAENRPILLWLSDDDPLDRC